jgi:hypothetical protein
MRTEEEYMAVANAAAAAHGMLIVLAENGMDPIHRPQAVGIVNRIGDVLWPGDPAYQTQLKEEQA